MRRVITALAIAGTLAGGTACEARDGSSAGPTSAAPTSGSPSPSPTPSPSDYTADTKKACDEIDKTLETRMPAFGEQLGKMIAYREAKKTTEARRARTAAQQELAELAEFIQKRTAAAQDPELMLAGAQSARNIRATGADAEFFDRFRLRDLDALNTEMARWLAPLNSFCT